MLYSCKTYVIKMFHTLNKLNNQILFNEIIKICKIINKYMLKINIIN